jgi:hypothetical protein
MARIDDIVDLMRVANETYIINPSLNIRAAYIQIDDLCELSFKSFLESRINGWSANRAGGGFKLFHEIKAEVDTFFPGDTNFLSLTTRINDRRTNRNRFFHDQRQSALTVDDRHCLEAFVDFYTLLNYLFTSEYKTSLNNNVICHTQVMLIKLKLKGLSGGVPYNTSYSIYANVKTLMVPPNTYAFDCIAINKAEVSYKHALKIINEQITLNNGQIDKIRTAVRLKKQQCETIERLEHTNIELQKIIDECF